MKTIEDQENNLRHGAAEPSAVQAGSIRAIARRLQSPLLILWVLCAVGVIGGLGEWLFFDRSPWEGLGAAAAIAGLIGIVARVKGVPPWPWKDRDDD